VIPSCQDFKTGQSAGVKFNYRLKARLKFIVLERSNYVGVVHGLFLQCMNQFAIRNECGLVLLADGPLPVPLPPVPERAAFSPGSPRRIRSDASWD
jgi:hypothetical protein